MTRKRQHLQSEIARIRDFLMSDFSSTRVWVDMTDSDNINGALHRINNRLIHIYYRSATAIANRYLLRSNHLG